MNNAIRIFGVLLVLILMGGFSDRSVASDSALAAEIQ